MGRQEMSRQSPPRRRRFINTEHLIRLADAGMTALVIGEELGFTRMAVYRHATRHGINIRQTQFPESEFWAANGAKMRELIEAGFSTAAVGRMLGITKNAVIGRINRDRGYLRVEKPYTPVVRRRDPFPPAGTCLFPIGNPPDSDFHFCGGPLANAGKPYCGHHNAKAYLKIKRSETEATS